ncbi:MAG: hypothetical protein WDM80_15525 [Limisphaerales bacterium]
MSEEIFDIVNERDEVIGQAPRKEVHARGLWHRAVHVLVFNARGEVFLQKRSMLKGHGQGQMGFVVERPSGHGRGLRHLRGARGARGDRPEYPSRDCDGGVAATAAAFQD